MAKKGTLLLSFKTPYTSVTRAQIKKGEGSSEEKSLSALMEDLSLSAVNIVARQVREKADVMKMRNFQIIATFFQRVCSRTPLDEPYDTKELRTIKGKVVAVTVHHEPDIQRVRWDWYILDKKTGNKIFTAGRIVSEKPDVFDKYDDKESVMYIKNLLFEYFNKQNASDMQFTIGNDNPYFAVLEYGGYKTEKSSIKKGELYEHGIEHRRSVQAPMGMFRITEMELDSIIDNAAKTPLSTRYKNQKTKKILDKSRAKQLLKKLQATTAFDVEDLLKIVGD